MEFEEMFKSEQACIDYLVSLRWPNGFGPPMWLNTILEKNKERYECSDCHKETTVTNNTMFHKSTKPLRIWFHAIWWMVAQKMVLVQRDCKRLGLGSYQTA